MNDRHADGHTAGPWAAYNMVGPDGHKLTPEEIGEYVTNAVRNGDPDRFLFVQQRGAKDVDICHVGNGPDGPYNARLIAAAPTMLAALREAREHIAEQAERLDRALKDPESRPSIVKDFLSNKREDCNARLATIDAAIQQATGGSDGEPECKFCGTSSGLRIDSQDPWGGHREYVCAECFIGRDDGPCFDDLPEATE